MYSCVSFGIIDWVVCVDMTSVNLPAWIQAIGSVLAIFVAVYIVRADHRKQDQQDKAKKRTVARALMYEMSHALKFLAAGHKELTTISKKSGSVSASEIRLTYPSHRKIYSALGENIGVLSEKAVHAAVNFDHYMQALERDFEFEVGHIHIASTLDPATALKLANKISSTIKYTTEQLECMAGEAFGGTIPEATKEIIRGLKNLVENKVSN